MTKPFPNTVILVGMTPFNPVDPSIPPAPFVPFIQHAASSTPLAVGIAPSFYPASRKSDQVDVLHGVTVADPYRWLENLDTPETKAWVDAQATLTGEYLAQIPAREILKQRLTQLWNYERVGTPFRKGGRGGTSRYFFFKNDGLQNQSVLYTLPTLDAEPCVLIDPNGFSEDGTVSLSVMSVSEDGEYLAYGTSASGSDWETWRVRRISDGLDLPDRLDRIKFSSPTWAADGKGFYYGRFDGNVDVTGKFEGVNRFQKLCFHRLGNSQSQDEVVYHRPDQPEWGFAADLSEDGETLIIAVWKGTDPRNLVFWKDLRVENAPVKELVADFHAKFTPIGDDGDTLFFLTDWDAPRGRIVGIAWKDLDRSAWREIVPQSDDTLEGVHLVGCRLVAEYLQDAHSVVRAFARDGKPLGEIALPGLGTAGGFTGEWWDMETFFSFTGFTTPTEIYRHDFKTGVTTLFRKPVLDFDASRFVTRQVFVSGRDGARVPMFLVHRQGLVMDGGNPTYLYGYGGFSISLTPAFSTGNLPWLEAGGVYAVACIRGGGEYGEAWHRDGCKDKKQNGFDDFIAAAEWLIAEGVTRSRRLAIGGGSNGGLLAAACMVQRPELFGAVVPAVGVLDMLRFHKFTIGWAWESDYGSPNDPEDFRRLLAYSPLHNLRPGVRYPPTLIITADHDDRVVPCHSFKFAAALQACLKEACLKEACLKTDPEKNSEVTPTAPSTAEAFPNPALIRIETKAGHGAGKPMAKVIEETADKWAFLIRVLRVNFPLSS